MSRPPSLLEQVLQSSSSDEEDEFFVSTAHIVHSHYQSDSAPKHGGSMVGHKVIDREREEGHWRLYQDYFADEPTYDPTFFRRRFRMHRHLYLRIMHAVEDHDDYFVQKRNAAGKLGLSCLQKVTAAFRMLAYGVPADATDEKIRIAEIVDVFEDEYLRSPNDNDTARLLELGEERGFPGMYSGHVHEPTIILEAVASHDLWIWHAFFGLPGSHNDINVLHRSPLFAKLADGQAPKVGYSINGHDYTMGYYLADGIYPSWATFVKTIPEPQGNKRKYFAIAQESVRKDVERAFGVLQARFAIVRGPAHF
ncbi:uncharacterized protein [Setaria viridis]|uniref:uncharacterized protein n=1 Tax=Setaria viridis TaxID=4556 RepID=UPI003B3BCB4D